MKDTQVSILFMLCVLGVFLLLLLHLFGERRGVINERERIYTKCLTEHEALPHKDAVVLCKERVK